MDYTDYLHYSAWRHGSAVLSQAIVVVTHVMTFGHNSVVTIVDVLPLHLHCSLWTVGSSTHRQADHCLHFTHDTNIGHVSVHSFYCWAALNQTLVLTINALTEVGMGYVWVQSTSDQLSKNHLWYRRLTVAGRRILVKIQGPVFSKPLKQNYYYFF